MSARYTDADGDSVCFDTGHIECRGRLPGLQMVALTPDQRRALAADLLEGLNDPKDDGRPTDAQFAEELCRRLNEAIENDEDRKTVGWLLATRAEICHGEYGGRLVHRTDSAGYATASFLGVLNSTLPAESRVCASVGRRSLGLDSFFVGLVC